MAIRVIVVDDGLELSAQILRLLEDLQEPPEIIGRTEFEILAHPPVLFNTERYEEPGERAQQNCKLYHRHGPKPGRRRRY